MENIGEKIRIQRLIKNYSQEYMAFALDISQAAYSNIERNETKITLERVFEIAEILEISPFELMPKPKNGTGINAEYFWRTIKNSAASGRQRS
jgi:transcriptional regulator with XRE-family HTH domain